MKSSNGEKAVQKAGFELLRLLIKKKKKKKKKKKNLVDLFLKD
jgi:hypothetical protein